MLPLASHVTAVIQDALQAHMLVRATNMHPLFLLCQSLDSGAITPHFHVVFDDWFATTSSDHLTAPEVGSMEWNKVFGGSE
jgi:hypothetical protein